jgi:integrase
MPKWPSYVREVNGRIVYRPRIPKGKQGILPTDKSGFLRPPIKLGKIGDREQSILRAYLAAKERLESQSDLNSGTLNWLKGKYLDSPRFKKLRAKTQYDYEQKLNLFLSGSAVINGVADEVGSIHPNQITKPFLRKLLDRMLEEYQQRGRDGRSYINGQFRCFSAMLTYGMQYHESLGLDNNPCIGIELHVAPVVDRYVTDEDYMLQYEFARLYAADWLPVFFEHAYLLASRSIEITDLTISSVTDEGYFVERRKGSKDNIILFSDRLKDAFEAAITLRNSRKKLSDILITTRGGIKLSSTTIGSAMQRLKKKMTKAGLNDTYWTLHDLKRKGISDAKDDRIGGHKTEEMRQRYKVILDRIPAAN